MCMRWLYLFSFFTCFSINARQVDFNTLLNDYQQVLEAKLKKKGIPGAALSIVSKKHPSYVYAYGKTSHKSNRKVTRKTRFRLASVSKTFAGSLSAKLIEQQHFDLDDTVAKYLPDFYFETRDKKLRIKHLISHSSGLVPNAYDNLIESRMAYDSIVKRLSNVEPICSPGRCYGYQNVMFSLIGDVIEQSTGLSYQKWLDQFIFKPLNMRKAGVGYAHMTQDDDYARPHVRARKRWYVTQLKENYYKVGPAAGVNASADDMVQWLKAQLGMYPNVLSPSALKLQVNPQIATKKELKRRIWRQYVNQAHYGLGWRIYDYQGITLYYHSGWVQGYRADIVIVPELELGYSLMLNAEAGIINELTNDFLQLALNHNKTSITNSLNMTTK